MSDLDPAPVLDALASDPRLRVFLRGGRIEAIPAKHSRRLLLLDQIAQAFEPGVRYMEGEVSEFLSGLHPDYASLRPVPGRRGTAHQGRWGVLADRRDRGHVPGG